MIVAALLLVALSTYVDQAQDSAKAELSYLYSKVYQTNHRESFTLV